MKQEPLIRVLLADDHAIVRKGLASLLAQEPDIVVVGEAETGQQAVTLAKSLAPDVVVMDIGMPNLNGVEATRRISKVSPRTHVLILSMHQMKEYISQALRAGAAGYLLKNTDPNVLIDAIREVRRGKSYLSPEISRTVIQDYVQRADELEALQKSDDPLSSREREILQLIAEGKVSKEIAQILSISAKTVENHRKNIMRKLGIHNMAGLVQYALRHGISPNENFE